MKEEHGFNEKLEQIIDNFENDIDKIKDSYHLCLITLTYLNLGKNRQAEKIIQILIERIDQDGFLK